MLLLEPTPHGSLSEPRRLYLLISHPSRGWDIKTALWHFPGRKSPRLGTFLSREVSPESPIIETQEAPSDSSGEMELSWEGWGGKPRENGAGRTLKIK